jgi:class 3 adenylate cyclase
MATLRILKLDDPDAQPQVFVKEETIHIGRSSRCEVRVPIDSAKISRLHTRLINKPDGWFVADLGRSGTYLNESKLVPLIPTLLRPDDVIRIGEFRFRVLRSPGTEESLDRYHMRVATIDLAHLDAAMVLKSAMELPAVLGEAGSEAEVYARACTYLISALRPAISAVYVVVARPDQEGQTDILAREASGHAARPLLSRRVIDAVCEAKESVVFLHEHDPEAALQATVLPSTRAVGACLIEYAPDGAPVVIYMVGEHIIDHGEEMLASYLRLVATLTQQHIATLRRVALTKYFSPNVVQLLMQRGGSSAAEGQPQVAEVTSMFFDLRGFSLEAEASADDLLPLAQDLRQVMDIVADEVFRTHGTIIDYQGDGCFAAWGVPFEQPDQSLSALACALQVSKRLRETTFGGFGGGCGIGVAFGECLAGSVGSSTHFKYGVLGPSVNVAARLEALTKPDRLHAPILLSEAVFHRVSDSALHMVRVGRFVLAGMQQPTNLYELLMRSRLLAQESHASLWHGWLARLEAARSLVEIDELVAEVCRSNLGESPRVQWLLRRCHELAQGNALSRWDGIHYLAAK